MANKLKTGLDYFPVDIDIYEDDKIIPLLSEHGANGETILFRLLSALYRNGHYIDYSEKLLFKLSHQTHIPKETVRAVVETLVQSEFFDKDSYDNNMVLTSKGIQKRYQIAARRRKATDTPLMYWLLKPMIQDHNVPESDYADNMSTESDNMHDES